MAARTVPMTDETFGQALRRLRQAEATCGGCDGSGWMRVVRLRLGAADWPTGGV